MKVFCFGCGLVRQADGTWKKEDFDTKTDSSTMCPACLEINRKIMQKMKKEKVGTSV